MTFDLLVYHSNFTIETELADLRIDLGTNQVKIARFTDIADQKQLRLRDNYLQTRFIQPHHRFYTKPRCL
ncbi:hypothetical protein ScPMuIL_000146 [Solemya velum]